jgi:type I restriction enzyme S subunit
MKFKEQRRIVAYLDGLSERVNELPAPVLSGRRLQAESQEKLDALLPSVLDRAFKGEL